MKTEGTEFMFRLVTVCGVISFFMNKTIPNFDGIKSSHLCCLCFQILIALLFLSTYIALKSSSYVTLSVIFVLPWQQVLFVLIQAPAIPYVYH